MVSDINIFDINMKLNIFYKSDYILIIIEDYNNYEIEIV